MPDTPAQDATGRPKVVGRVQATVSYLEMLERPVSAPLQPPAEGCEIVKAIRPTVAFYRFLYGTVGGPWLWWSRRYLRDEELVAIIHDEKVDIRVLWVHGVPAGFVEFDGREDGEVELAFFGLMPEFIGRGLGRYLLDWSVHHAWRRPIRRLWVHTCDLDHPRALAGYENAGFSLFDREQSYENLLENMTLPQHVADRIIEAP
ncbi:MAG: GNAT family N-acetyltransferase [Geminicoccaceae bacterium]